MGKFLLVVIVFAALVYTFFWLIERRRAGTPGAGPRSTPKPQPRTLAPDDDEDFLRDLNRRNRHPDQDHPNE